MQFGAAGLWDLGKGMCSTACHSSFVFDLGLFKWDVISSTKTFINHFSKPHFDNLFVLLKLSLISPQSWCHTRGNAEHHPVQTDRITNIIKIRFERSTTYSLYLNLITTLNNLNMKHLTPPSSANHPLSFGSGFPLQLSRLLKTVYCKSAK